MKKIGLVFSLVLFFSISFQLNAQWFWQNPTPLTSEFLDTYFVNDNYGWAIGNYGTIIKTVNGGQDWEVSNCQINPKTVSYKHLTLPTSDLKEISVGAVFFKKKTILKL